MTSELGSIMHTSECFLTDALAGERQLWDATCANSSWGTTKRFLNFLGDLDWKIGKTKHFQTYNAFLRAASLGIDPEFAFREIVCRIEMAGGMLDIYQVRRQQQRAIEYILGEASSPELRPAKQIREAFSWKDLRRIAGNIDLANPIKALMAVSPLSVSTVTASGFLDCLFLSGERILVFTTMKSQGQALYTAGSRKDADLPQRGPEGVWFLVQPVDGLDHLNPRNGRFSRRSEEAVTSWRYLVLESDEAAADDWMRALVQLPLPIVAIYTSGGRSIHALVRVDASSKPEWDQVKNAFKPIVVKLGADSNALTAVRLSRLPQCWRGDSRQELLYLNPGADGTPILASIIASGAATPKGDITCAKLSAHRI